MKQHRYVAYYRVSTQRQGASGLGLEGQRQAVSDHLTATSGKLLTEYTEIESGRRDDRPKLAEAIADARRHRATLIIARLDRLARRVSFVATLMDSGVEFVACDMPSANRLTIHILAAVAEEEARAISARTKAALAAAKARGVKLGNPQGWGGRVYDNGAAVKAASERHARDVLPIIAGLHGEGRSLRQIASHLIERDIPTARGGIWTAASVRNVLLRHRP